MKRETELSLMERLLALFEGGTTALASEESTLSVDHYRSPPRFSAERDVLFRRRPLIAAHASEIASPGDYLTLDVLGEPLFVARDREGQLHAMLNVCRHRGARLLTLERGNQKAIVCGYHGWTYGLDGALMHIPHAAGFSRDCDRGLVRVGVAERAGFIWILPSRDAMIDLNTYLGPLGEELDDLGLAGHVAYRTTSVTRRFNWKLIIDAFLDGYHIKKLHRDSVYRFFVDNVNIADAFLPHVRSIVARKSIEKLRGLPREQWRLSDALSLTYFVFPNTVLVFHPDWVSRITVFPTAIDETRFTHTMIVPPGEDTVERRAHWDKTWSLIQEGVFEREDMAAAEWIQSCIGSSANQEFSCGRFEFPIRWFHDELDRALAQP